MSAFYFAQQFVAGVCAAMLIFLFWPDGAKTMLTISGLALVGFNLYEFAHYDLRHLVPAIRLFCMGNGLFIGIAIASAASRRRKGNGLEDRAV